MLSNLIGVHRVIILTVLLVFAAVIVDVVFTAVALARRSQVPASRSDGLDPRGGAASSGTDASARVARLEDLKRRGQVTDAEYSGRHRAIVDEL